MRASACRTPSAASRTRRRFPAARRRHQLQPLSHHLDLLTHARGAAHRAQSPARRQRHHRRAGGGLGWLHGSHAEDSATIAEVLKNYGYKTSAFGKWHNTPADQTTAMGPFTYWPTSYGFEYFYGFLAGETSQWEPRLVENTTAIEPPHDEKYHLTEDMADKGIAWLKKHRAFSPDKPFLHVLGAGRRPWSAPRRRAMGRQIQRQVRRGLGQAS